MDNILMFSAEHNCYDNDPWILKLVDFVKKILDQQRVRIIGVCYGHQIVGRAMGMETGPNDKGWEIAVCPVKMTKKGQELFKKETIVSIVTAHTHTDSHRGCAECTSNAQRHHPPIPGRSRVAWLLSTVQRPRHVHQRPTHHTSIASRVQWRNHEDNTEKKARNGSLRQGAVRRGRGTRRERARRQRGGAGFPEVHAGGVKLVLRDIKMLTIDSGEVVILGYEWKASIIQGRAACTPALWGLPVLRFALQKRPYYYYLSHPPPPPPPPPLTFVSSTRLNRPSFLSHLRFLSLSVTRFALQLRLAAVARSLRLRNQPFEAIRSRQSTGFMGKCTFRTITSPTDSRILTRFSQGDMALSSMLAHRYVSNDSIISTSTHKSSGDPVAHLSLAQECQSEGESQQGGFA